MTDNSGFLRKLLLKRRVARRNNLAGVNDCLSTRRFASRPLLHKELLMLSPEDEQMLGMPSTTHRRSSAVSQILRKISVGLKCEPVDWDVCDDENVDGHYHIRIA